MKPAELSQGVAIESKRELAKAKTRRALLKSALQLYSQEGSQGLSMNKVAKGAGIAQPSFYNHFESLDALQQELCELLKESYLSPMRMAWVSMLEEFDSLSKELLDHKCRQCLGMIFDAAFQNIDLFQHLIEDRPRLGQDTNHGLGGLVNDLQEEWIDLFSQGLTLSGRTFTSSSVNLFVDTAAAQVHELILGCHQQRYQREQAIQLLSTSFQSLFISLFASETKEK